MIFKYTEIIHWSTISFFVIFLLSFYSIDIIFNSPLILPGFAQISNLNAAPNETQVQDDEVVVKNVGILSVTTGVNDLTSRPLDEKFTVTDITNEITGITAEPKIFQATTQPQIVELASTGTYGVTVFLKVEDVSGTLTQLVNLAKIQDIIDDQGGFTDLLPLLQFISNGQISSECTGNSSIGTTNSCTIVITFYDEYLDIIEDFVGFDIAGISGTGGNLDQGNQFESASGGVLGISPLNQISEFKFKNMTLDSKLILLNILNIKPNTPIQYNSLSCLQVDNTGTTGFNSMTEITCDDLMVFGTNETTNMKKTEDLTINFSKGPVLASLLLNALDEGFDKPISACALLKVNRNSQQSSLSNIDCHSLVIAFK